MGPKAGDLGCTHDCSIPHDLDLSISSPFARAVIRAGMDAEAFGVPAAQIALELLSLTAGFHVEDITSAPDPIARAAQLAQAFHQQVLKASGLAEVVAQKAEVDLAKAVCAAVEQNPDWLLEGTVFRTSEGNLIEVTAEQVNERYKLALARIAPVENNYPTVPANGNP